MGDNASHRADPPEEGTDRNRGRNDARAAPSSNSDVLIKALPDRFRSAGSLLARELYGAPDRPHLERDGRATTGDPRWYTDLELEEAWAVAQAFRRRMVETAAGATGSEADAQEVAELHAALDRSLLAAARDSLERSSDAHRRVIQDVSHDLRSPLNSVLFLADALRSRHSGSLNAVQGHQLNVLYTAAVTLVRMTNDLIDFSRIGAGRERIVVSEATFSLETVVHEASSLVAPLASHRGVEVVTHLDAEGVRQGDQRLLGRVLLNLVSNAIEAVDHGGTVTLRFGDTDEGNLRIEVADDRCGTEVEVLRQFLAVTDDQWPGETRGWTRGLGLNISARFIQAAGGRIDVLSRAGEGTVFRVELPFPRL